MADSSFYSTENARVWKQTDMMEVTNDRDQFCEWHCFEQALRSLSFPLGLIHQ